VANRIWVCNDPNHSGVRAPGRMRRDDIRRFCWPCSQATGYLVERHAPALERKRKAAKAQRQEREQRQREQVRETRMSREVIDGVDIRKEVARLIRLPALRDELPRYLRGKRVPLTLHRGDHSSYSGHAVSRGWVHLTLGRISAPMVRAIVCHELAHYALPDDVHHDGRWQRCYVRVVNEAYGTDLVARPGEKKYELDRRVMDALGAASDAPAMEENGG
jgi:hypothetical protein